MISFWYQLIYLLPSNDVRIWKWHEIDTNLISLCYLGTGIGAFLQTFMLALAGEKLTFRLRIQTFRSILWQKIEWFDRQENSVGALCNRLSSDASAIQGATGARIGLLIQVSVSSSFSLIFSMFYSWKLALVCGVFVPFVLLSAMFAAKMNTVKNDSENRYFLHPKKWKVVPEIGHPPCFRVQSQKLVGCTDFRK